MSCVLKGTREQESPTQQHAHLCKVALERVEVVQQHAWVLGNQRGQVQAGKRALDGDDLGGDLLGGREQQRPLRGLEAVEIDGKAGDEHLEGGPSC